MMDPSVTTTPPAIDLMNAFRDALFHRSLGDLRAVGDRTVEWNNNQILNPMAIYDWLGNIRRIAIDHPLYGENRDEIVSTLARHELLRMHDAKMLPEGISINMLLVHKSKRDRAGAPSEYSTTVTGNLAEQYDRALQDKRIGRPLILIDIDSTKFELTQRSHAPLVNLICFCAGSAHTTGPIPTQAILAACNTTDFDALAKAMGYCDIELPRGIDANPLKTPKGHLSRLIFPKNGDTLISVHQGEDPTLKATRDLLAKSNNANLDITSPFCLITHSINSLLEQAWAGINRTNIMIDNAWNPLALRSSLTKVEVRRLKEVNRQAIELKHLYEDIFRELNLEVDRIKREKLFDGSNSQVHLTSAERAVNRVSEIISGLCRRIGQIKDRTERQIKSFQDERENQQKINLQLGLATATTLLALSNSNSPIVDPKYFIWVATLGLIYRCYRYWQIGRRPLME